MKLNFTYLGVTVILIILLVACRNCDEETETCNGLSTFGRSLLPQNIEYNVYTNGNDSTISINKISSFIRSTKINDCMDGFFYGCDCSAPCESLKGSIKYKLPNFKGLDSQLIQLDSGSYHGNQFITKDSSYHITYSISYGEIATSVYEGDYLTEPEIRVRFNKTNFRFGVSSSQEGYQISLKESDGKASILPNYKTPFKDYLNVVLLDRKADSLSATYPKKLYYDISDGVIAFEDDNGTLFYQNAR